MSVAVEVFRKRLAHPLFGSSAPNLDVARLMPEAFKFFCNHDHCPDQVNISHSRFHHFPVFGIKLRVPVISLLLVPGKAGQMNR